METEQPGGEQVHFLVFELDGQHYGVDVEQVEAIVECEAGEGTWCYEGKDVPVEPLWRLVGLDQPGDQPSRVLLSRSGAARRGFLVPTPRDIVTLAMEMIFPVPDLIRRVLGPSPLWGVGQAETGLLLLVDLGRARA